MPISEHAASSQKRLVGWLVGGCRGEEKGDPPLLTVVRAIKQSGGGAQGIPAKTQKRERRKKLSCFFLVAIPCL